MPFRQHKSRKHVPLPIVGHTLVHVHTESLVSLVFAALDGLQSQIVLEFEIILSRADGSSEVVAATRPGTEFDPNAAYATISSLLEKVVIRAVAHSDGRLEVTFEEGTTLQVHPDNYEAWHFQQPAPSSRKPYHYPSRSHFSITGYGGGLIN